MKAHSEDDISLGQVAYEAYAENWLERTGYYEPAWENIDDTAQAAWEAAADAVAAFAEE